MSAPPSARCPHHIPCHEFSCRLQGPDKGNFLPVASGATRKSLQQAWLCGGVCPPLSFLSLHPSLVARGKRDVVGMCSPCWVLLINMRNGTRGCEAPKQSVISYMGFAKCLSSPASKQGSSGPASVRELCVIAEPPGLLSAALAHSVPGPGCVGMCAMAKSLLPAPGCQQHGHLSPPLCSLYNIYAPKCSGISEHFVCSKESSAEMFCCLCFLSLLFSFALGCAKVLSLFSCWDGSSRWR